MFRKGDTLYCARNDLLAFAGLSLRHNSMGSNVIKMRVFDIIENGRLGHRQVSYNEAHSSLPIHLGTFLFPSIFVLNESGKISLPLITKHLPSINIIHHRFGPSYDGRDLLYNVMIIDQMQEDFKHLVTSSRSYKNEFRLNEEIFMLLKLKYS